MRRAVRTRSEARPAGLRDQSGKVLTVIVGLVVSYAIVFATTFYLMNGRSFQLRRPAPPVPSQSAQVTELDSLQLLAMRLDSLRRLVDSTRFALDSLVSEVNRKRTELAALEEKLNASGKQERQEELRRARKLASILAALPDSAVAPMVARLDDELLVMVLQKSPEKSAARVLAALDARRAARLSERLVRLD